MLDGVPVVLIATTVLVYGLAPKQPSDRMEPNYEWAPCKVQTGM